MDRVERKLAAIFAADVAGYSRNESCPKLMFSGYQLCRARIFTKTLDARPKILHCRAYVYQQPAQKR